MSVEQFRARYAGIKPYFEYWHGEAVQKTSSTWLHSLVQRLIADLLEEGGYYSGIEIELRIDENWQPVPDVVGATSIEQPYPARPVELVVEILSPEDRFSRVVAKCREYVKIGVMHVFVIDPEQRIAYQWNAGRGHLENIDAIMLPNGNRVELTALWSRVDAKLNASH